MKEEYKVVQIGVEDILPNRFQPRLKFNEEAIIELSESIKEHGVIHPILVRQIDDKYEIIAGERRYKASLLAGKQMIPAIITDLNDKDSSEVALIENIQRKDLTPIEEAISYKKLLDMGSLTQEMLATKLGKTQSTVANKLRLLNLDEEVQDALLEEKISERHARSLLRLPLHKQSEVANKIIQERMTVRKTDEYIKQILEQPDDLQSQQEIKKGVPIKLKMEPVVTEKNEKAENNMNQSQNDIRTILPSEPIVEELEDLIPQAPISQNPGFMDVDKIQQVATDINVSKPTVDMNQLLQSDPSIQTNISTVPNVTKTEDSDSDDSDDSDEYLLKPGKFFTLNDIENTPSETIGSSVSNNLVNPIYETQNPQPQAAPTTAPSTSNMPTFGSSPMGQTAPSFDFDQFFKTTTPQPVTPTPEVTVAQTPSNPPMDSFVNSSTSLPKMENLEELDVTMDSMNQSSQAVPSQNPNPSMPAGGTFFNFDFMNNSTPTDPTPSMSAAPQEIVQNVPSMEPMPTQPASFSQPDLMASSNNMSSISNSNFDATNVGYSSPEPQPVVSNPATMPMNPYVTVSQPVNEPTSTTVEPFRPGAGIGTDFSTPTDEFPIPLMETKDNRGTYVAVDLKMVINTIRDCAATIEKYGYVIDTEELDFEDRYEVTFKIEKK